jgi:hypothetical protein
MVDDKLNSNGIKKNRPPSPAEERWFDYTENLPFLSDEYLAKFADKMYGLNTAVIAVYIAGIKLTVSNPGWYFWIPLILFLISLLTVLFSIFPKRVFGVFENLQDVKYKYLEGIMIRQTQI